MKPLFHLVIAGDPVAKGRPKFAVIGGHARAYTPKKTRDYEETITLAAVAQGLKNLPHDLPLAVDIWIYLPAPKSLPAKIRRAIEAGDETVPVVKKPDVDNITKLCCDALEGVCWRDQQIVDLFASKRYSVNPRVEIICREWEGSCSS